ncbi:MAG TPA: hypothetical protein PKM59_11465 [Thermodesulfobacteriota bacterium]|nr:hypothetical protein [Thermodesulfobacteriota bacterium]HNU71828.1 hypothetical protein [Thermodesulfobacteriota bacterium]
MVKISEGNSKTGKVPNISLPRGVGCPADAPCMKRGQCYCRAFARYPTTIKAHQHNLAVLEESRDKYFESICWFLSANQPRFFRWHVCGDVVDQDYFNRMCDVARKFPNIKFLVFTKRHELDFSGRPKNLTVIASMWPKWGDLKLVRKKRLPVAWVQNGTEDRVPKSALECHGGCENCGMCWHLGELKRDVIFFKH